MSERPLIEVNYVCPLCKGDGGIEEGKLAEYNRLAARVQELEAGEAVSERHDHRKSTWLIAGGMIVWCYRCGAWRANKAGRWPWHKPTGPDGENPAMSAHYRFEPKGEGL